MDDNQDMSTHNIETTRDITVRFEWERAEVEKRRATIATETYTGPKGETRWIRSNNIVPPHAYRDAQLEATALQVSEYETETRAFLDEYRRREANRQPSAEEMFEMRAAFGPGTEVVNVITGRRIRL